MISFIYRATGQKERQVDHLLSKQPDENDRERVKKSETRENKHLHTARDLHLLRVFVGVQAPTEWTAEGDVFPAADIRCLVLQRVVVAALEAFCFTC